MTNNIWKYRCHAKVNWNDVASETEPVTRTEYGSIIVEHTIFALRILDSPTVRDAAKRSARLPEHIQEWRNRNDKPLPEDIEAVVGFARETEFFVGYRQNWLPESRSKKDEAGAENLVRFLNEMLPYLDGVERDDITYDTIVPGAEMVDFERNLISVGGPVANWYTRNLLYGDEQELPYKFNLNPEPERIDLADCSPYELRLVGRSPDSRLDRSPNWHITGADGNPATFGNEEAKPEWSIADQQWETDYFMIVKTKNVHPSAKHIPRTSLTVAGCHGFGTYAAIESLLDPDVVETLAEEAGDGFFQAIGRVTRGDDQNSEGDEDMNLGNVEILNVEPIDL